MVGWHHQLCGHEFEQDGEGQGSLACYSPWGRKEDRTEQLNNHNPKGSLDLPTANLVT